ncbi:MAG: peroxide stress protein YaaA [Actinomycetaceae bacterium]|nr:peroxide stress protein YaaA [Actinomycetaceae bacterium]
MKILLPPSQGKTSPPVGPPLALDALSLPELTAAREPVVTHLIEASRREDAPALLGVGPRLHHEIEAQQRLLERPCAPAREVYTGVLYEAARLTPADEVWVFSALFGPVGGNDPIPAYRLAMSAALPGIGSLKAYWRRELARLPWDDSQTYVDMRSAAYQVWNPPGLWWDVRVRDGNGRVISHMAKRYRGLLARALLDAGSDEIADVARTLGDVAVEHDGRRRHLTLTPTALAASSSA